jgi:hypothetical protein
VNTRATLGIDAAIAALPILAGAAVHARDGAALAGCSAALALAAAVAAWRWSPRHAWLGGLVAAAAPVGLLGVGPALVLAVAILIGAVLPWGVLALVAGSAGALGWAHGYVAGLVLVALVGAAAARLVLRIPVTPQGLITAGRLSFYGLGAALIAGAVLVALLPERVQQDARLGLGLAGLGVLVAVQVTALWMAWRAGDVRLAHDAGAALGLAAVAVLGVLLDAEGAVTVFVAAAAPQAVVLGRLGPWRAVGVLLLALLLYGLRSV